MFHHTEQWNDGYPDDDDPSLSDSISLAVGVCAATIKAREAERDRLRDCRDEPCNGCITCLQHRSEIVERAYVEARFERDRLREERDRALQTCLDAGVMYGKAMQEQSRLREALEKYGRHWETCPGSHPAYCECGLTAALRPAQAEPRGEQGTA
jgi:hypothetical protein